MFQDKAENIGIALAMTRLSNEVMGHYGRLNIPKSWCDGYIPFGLWFGTYRSRIIMIQDEAENIGIARATLRLSNEVMGQYGRLNMPKSWCDGYIPFGLWFGTYRSRIIMIQDEAENTGIALAMTRLSNEVMGHYGRLNMPKSWCDGYILNQVF